MTEIDKKYLKAVRKGLHRGELKLIAKDENVDPNTVSRILRGEYFKESIFNNAKNRAITNVTELMPMSSQARKLAKTLGIAS